MHPRGIAVPISLADSLNLHEAQNSILAGLGQVYNDLRNYQLAHFYFHKAERQYPPRIRRMSISSTTVGEMCIAVRKSRLRL